MTYASGAIRSGWPSELGFQPRKIFLLGVLGAVSIALCTAAGLLIFQAWPLAVAASDGDADLAAVIHPSLDTAAVYGALITPVDPSVTPPLLARQAPSAFAFDDEAPLAVAETADSVPVPVPDEVANSPDLLQPVPFPQRRPAEFAKVGPGPAHPPRPVAAQTAALSPAPADNRNFFEKLFGVQSTNGTALAYAAPEDGAVSRRTIVPPAMPASGSYDRFTAVYDISARTVYLPNGARLEAHSGLGNRLDDPRYVHEKNRGATPPSLYDLSLREALFHGVQAIRLTPVGNANVFGRDGLLAHTYMLGPKGDSNGCVSFRDYDAFLRAYRNGEVKRLAVVASLH